MRKRSVRKDFTLFGTATLLYMERSIEEVSTPEERGPTSFDSLRTVDGVLCATFREACQRLNLLENDTHWDSTLADATVSAPANQIRTLFAIIIATCHPSNPTALWDKYKDEMADDILHRVRTTTSNFDLEINDEMRNEALVLIEDICVLMCGSLLSTLGMPAPNRSLHDAFNRELQREQDYDQDELAERVRTNVTLLNAEQKNVYDSLMKVVDDGTGGIYFLDAPGGTGKTFLISLILAKIRSRSQIALAVASSGIAATLLEGGRTAHSAFKLPMNVLTVDQPTCTLTKNSATAKLMRECKIIIWDECTMAHKRALEAVDRTMKDLRGDSRRFGGAMILLSGDFRQTLPVIPKSTAADELNACLKSSSLWRHVKKFKLTTNMRVALQNDPSAAEFSRQLLALGNGQIPVDVSTGLVSFPANFCEFTSSKEELITKVFPGIAQNYKNLDWISERAILAAKNKDVDSLNFIIQSQIAGELHSYKSVDSVTDEDEATNYPTEFLNSLDVPGTPPHNLQLKRWKGKSLEEKNTALNPKNLVSTVKHGGNVMDWGAVAASGVGRIVFIEGNMDRYQYKSLLEHNLKPSVDNLELGASWIFQQDNESKAHGTHC
ncbi:PREDICTED: uncharacterized protein LOC108359826 [Rhagoletis zephyria]|uniref:uncharacterized protein LOC108359826 n=1 Tax=Rhagoletis zephyria TaxID=28612 RepID=UPI0008114A67|nr:PREDICTED: uncharacterized protein LOC108359826 [Rhagoletis zephyria]